MDPLRMVPPFFDRRPRRNEAHQHTIRAADEAAAGVVPLVAYGVVSVNSLRRGRSGRERATSTWPRRVGEQMERYIMGNIRILQAVGAELERTGLAGGSRIESSRTSSCGFVNSGS